MMLARAGPAGGVSAGEADSLLRQTIEVRRFVVGAAVDAQVVVTEVVGQDEEYVGRGGFVRLAGGEQQAGNDGKQVVHSHVGQDKHVVVMARPQVQGKL